MDIAPQPPSEHVKLAGHEWWDAIGRPKYVVAPMVDQSELAWRILSRIHGATLAYTPMFHAALFGSPQHPLYAAEMFDTSPGSIEGVAPYDRPLVVQFCANDKDQWLAAAKKVEGRCDAVDLNLGCPQGIAKKGHYGSFLMEEWDLIRGMISHLHAHLAIPVIAKLRVFPTLDKTLAYASHVFSSGAQLVTIHGRVREAKGRLAGYASWAKIKAVSDLLGSRVPVLANGGVPSAAEVEPCMEETGALGVMSAEGNLYNPMIFSPSNAAGGRDYRAILPPEMREALDLVDQQQLDPTIVGEWDRDLAAYAPATYLASQYLAIVRTLPKTQTAPSAIKAHLFKLFRPTWGADKHLETRETLGRAGGGKGLKYADRVQSYQDFVDEMAKRFKADMAAGSLPPLASRPLTHAEVASELDGVIPYSHAQPYMRVAPPAEPETTKEDAAVAAEATAKRAREEEVVGSAEVEESAPPAQKPKLDLDALTAAPPSAQAVVNSCATPSCVNAAASKCPHAVCSACCGTPSVGDGVMCETHKDKAIKEKAKADDRKRRALERKMAAKGKKLANGGGGGRGGRGAAVPKTVEEVVDASTVV